MSPILVRPVREQLEHDRLIRHLQQKYKRKFDVALNVGEEQETPVKIGSILLFPDLVLMTGRKLAGVIEVETGESVNNLEAMAQWVHFSRSRVPFHLYVPVTAYETARRLCEANQAHISEVWTYRAAADGFDLVRMSTDSSAVTKVRGPMATIVTLPPKPAPPPPVPVAPAPVASPVPATKTAAAPPATSKSAPRTPAPAPAAKPATVKPAAASSSKPAARPAGKVAARPATKPVRPAAKPARKAAPAARPRKPASSARKAAGRRRR